MLNWLVFNSSPHLVLTTPWDRVFYHPHFKNEKKMRHKEVRWLARKRQSCDWIKGWLQKACSWPWSKEQGALRTCLRIWKISLHSPYSQPFPAFAAQLGWQYHWPTDLTWISRIGVALSQSRKCQQFHMYLLGYEEGLRMKLGSGTDIMPCQHNHIPCTLW